MTKSPVRKLTGSRRLCGKTFFPTLENLRLKWASLNETQKLRYVRSAADMTQKNADLRAAAKVRMNSDPSPVAVQTQSLAALVEVSNGSDSLPAAQLVALGKQLTWNGSRLEIVRALGSGSSGNVYLAEDVASGLQHAVKLPREEEGAPCSAELVQEQEILRRFSHPGIVACWGVVTSAKTSSIGLVLQLASSNLSAWLREQKAAEPAEGSRNPEARLARYRICLQLTQAVQYIHGKAILHGDLKPGNTLVHPTPLQVQLADFGLSRMMTPSESERCDMLYTPCYRPAELLIDGCARTRLSPSLDVWALTCTFFDAFSQDGKRYLFPNPNELHGLPLSQVWVRCAQHVARMCARHISKSDDCAATLLKRGTAVAHLRASSEYLGACLLQELLAARAKPA